MKSLRFRFLVAALAVVLCAAIGNSQVADESAPSMHDHEMGMEGHGMGMGHEMGFLARQLDLTDAQRTQMKAVLHKEHATMKPLMLQVHQMEQQLRQYVEGTYDEAKVQALVSQQAQTLVQVKVQETRIHNELYQLLTPEQQAKLKELEARHEAHMQERMREAPANDSQQ